MPVSLTELEPDAVGQVAPEPTQVQFQLAMPVGMLSVIDAEVVVPGPLLRRTTV
jgi:hypothetical protein